MDPLESFRSQAADQFRAEVQGRNRILSLAHSDVDGLSAAAIFSRALDRGDTRIETLLTGKGENPWSEGVQARLTSIPADLLLVSDLGSRKKRIAAQRTVIVDHHRPLGHPDNAVLISGYGLVPTPTSGLIAWWCVEGLGDAEDLAWIAGISVLADMADESLLTLLPGRKKMKSAATREAISLLNAARRSASGDATSAFSLLLKATSLEDVTSSRHPEVETLKAMRREVQTELTKARRIGPKFPPKKADAERVAIIPIHSPCQVHPLIAQQWRTRLKNYVVIAANTGFRPGFVHFSARSAADLNLLDFLQRYAPSDTGEGFGNGHNRASGGALTHAGWNEFVRNLGFTPDLEITS